MDPPVVLPPTFVATVIPPPAPVAIFPSVAVPVPPVVLFTLIVTALAVAFVVVTLPPALIEKLLAPAPPLFARNNSVLAPTLIELAIVIPVAAVMVRLPPAVKPPEVLKLALDVMELTPLPSADKPRLSAILLTNVTLFAPELLSVTAPVKALLALVNVMELAPAVKLEVPVTVMAPV